MAHELQFTNGTADFLEVGARRSAWHREGILVEQPPESIEEAAKLIHADYTVEKRPTRFTCTTPDGDTYDKESAIAFVNVRTDTGAELGAVGPHYQVVQNVDAFRATIGPLVDSKILRIETGAVLRGGASAFMLGRLDDERFGPIAREVFAAEKIMPYVGIATDHSGARGNFLALTTIRWVCANTLGIDEARAIKIEKDGTERDDKLVTIAHRGDVEAKHVDAAQQLLGGLIERAEIVAKAYRTLKGFYLDEAMFRTLVIEPSIGKHPESRPEFNPEARMATSTVERWEHRERDDHQPLDERHRPRRRPVGVGSVQRGRRGDRPRPRSLPITERRLSPRRIADGRAPRQEGSGPGRVAVRGHRRRRRVRSLRYRSGFAAHIRPRSLAVCRGDMPMRNRHDISTLEPTRYEIVATNGADTFPIGFTRGTSRASLLAAMRLKAKEIIQRCDVDENDQMTFGYEKRGSTSFAFATCGKGWRIGYSGRTEREASAH